ncbi:Coenzyme F420 hydrogenase/dehydrogenase, beta subunit C-terminal domain [Aureliella helgolandensis]|uniref:Coenzyme F420-reducing hydrogenase subunit beta n=1 Tax=Aureliella helgolandensis TaxID=2527968 RepID=A0A518GFF1_9BACT|nr:Coenzyme F420 hydrogenase/dehydrogenase, beta subunit C-terminal domain [Aureliella helgolandensis]QDV27326.1 coenzyme F420-reducing hydrogenase subunit beta [Aureliella helgolandensis]
MQLPVTTIEEVCARQLCTGCGVCASVEPKRFRMADALEYGRRPFLVEQPAKESGLGLQCCPGASLEHTFDPSDPELEQELIAGWGPVYDVWEGFATDDAIRLAGSSGGAATALALYCIEQGGMSGVLHTGARQDAVHLNESVYSTSREELLDRTGSRYAPASPCDGLHFIEQAAGPSVFIGKPCDVAAVKRAQEVRPELSGKVGVTLAFFCAGTPSTQGTLELLKQVGVEDPQSIEGLRYRGNGWPGKWTVRWREPSGELRSSEMTYAESWGFLQKYRQWRCYICPDHTGEFADIAVGDPWYREVQPGEPGKSLIIARTPRGREIIQAAQRSGYLTLETRDATLLPRSQPNLLGTRGGLWARLKVLHVLGAAVPNLKGFETFPFWLRALGTSQKVQSFTGTIKRVFTKQLRRKASIIETKGEA